MNKKHFSYETWESEEMSTTETDKDKLQDFRVSTFEELGFSNKDSKSLAEAKHVTEINGKNYDFPLNWHYVKKMLDGGCTHELALKILL